MLKLLIKFLNWIVKPKLTSKEKYLAQSTDACDLERRIKDIQLDRTRNLPYL